MCLKYNLKYIILKNIFFILYVSFEVYFQIAHKLDNKYYIFVLKCKLDFYNAGNGLGLFVIEKNGSRFVYVGGKCPM